MIISTDLDSSQEGKLLNENKEALGWTMANIKGISPSIVQHRIHLREKTKPIKDPQRKLKPTMKEVVRKDIIKFLDNDNQSEL